tara:strand:- start:242 stop:802 length:561 start_codon:yes stop_codon:yes gene_type:complete
MRIISGLLKGKKIDYIRNSKTRPLKDSVKENIFNILKHSNLIKTKIDNSNILDLYCGIGSFGIECISRGAKKVTFIDKDSLALSILEKNIIQLKIKEKSNTINQKIDDALKNYLEDKYDVFFFDPPFADNGFIENLKTVKRKKLFNINHVVIIHRESNKIDNFEKIIKIISTKEYGRSKIIFGIFS